MMLARCFAFAAILWGAGAAWAGEPAHRKLTPVPFTEVEIGDVFWAPRIETNRTRTIPYGFKQCEQTGRISNFAKAGGLEPGGFEGIYFNDSDVYKMIEGAAYSLAAHPDPELDKYLDGVIAKIAAAQQKDGYLYTFYTVRKELDKRWSDTKSMHELYCAGHLIEAAVAHFRATGKRNLLDVAVRLADYIDSVFGPGKRYDVSGHEEIELALVKLYDLAGEARYLNLARFFLDQRGNKTNRRELHGDYCQDHKPIIEQTEPVGHAVRAMYLYCGMADVAALTGAKGYLPALEALWQSVITRKMHVTGGVGARHSGEAFGDNYELPNDTAYCETCAAIGNALWNHRMNLLTGEGRCADVLERVLYNGFLSGVSLDGEKFFYVNPLASKGTHHREPWFGCACCPVNVARILPSVPGYVYAYDTEGGIYVNLYAAGGGRIARKDAPAVEIRQETAYPWDGAVHIRVEPEKPCTFTLSLRIPAWCWPNDGPDDLYRTPPLKDEVQPTVKVSNKDAKVELDRQKGYARIRQEWGHGAAVELLLPMPVRRVYAHPEVKADAGRVALQRGPVVYCIEAADNGKSMDNLYLPADAPLEAEHRPDLLGGITVIKGKALLRQADGEPPRPVDLTAVPYYAWDHRAAGPMMVWIPEKPEAARAIPKPTVASESRVTASHVNPNDGLGAANDQVDPANSNDHKVPRMTWWAHVGTAEWIQYDFARPARVSSVEVYWFDDTGQGQCRVPKSWRLLYRKDGKWEPVAGASAYGVERDKFNRVTFTPVETDGLRIEVQLAPNASGGVLEWRVGKAD